ncbi:biotin/lipoyl-binding protein [Magnetovibrio sp. PR-2]|uniref:efflux RND transporter periplasmic adaptor subunit n=1 Tax=Magnetovibrio sp. PR-2 TaxID=3120356 RepID=UPI002FCE6033
MTVPTGQNNAYVSFLQLEQEARNAPTLDALGYVFANRIRDLVPIRQAVVFTMATRTGPKVQTISDVPTPDANAPMVRWLQSMAADMQDDPKYNRLHVVDVNSWGAAKRDAALHWLPNNILWCPFLAEEGHVSGGMLIASDQALSEIERSLIENLMGAWAHAWNAKLGTWGRRRRLPLGRTTQIVAALALAVQFIPVTQTALAPAEVVAKDPVLVAAPMNGVVETVHIEPNSHVKKGDLLFSFDDTELSGQLDVAQEELLVARTSLRTARQGAFRNAERNAEVAVLETQVKLSEAERNFIHAQVQRKDIYAEQGGVAVFRDVAGLEGRPVTTGERVMLIAKPHETKLQIELPVADAVVLETGAPVRLFLDRDPLIPVDAVLAYAGYEAEVTSSGVLSYRLVATFADGTSPRIGLRGMAKIEGKKVFLFFYLFRRPLSALRQWLGV